MNDKWPVFTRLTTNVKSKRIISVGLGPCTAFVSDDNRSMKTALASDSIRLALTGKHPIGHNPSDLIGLAGDPERGLSCSLTNGEASSSWALIVEDGKPKKPNPPSGSLSSLDPGSLIPNVAFRDLVELGSDRAREAIFKRFGTATAIPVPVGLTSRQSALWGSESGKHRDDPIGGLSSMASHFRAEKLRLGREAGMLEKAEAPAEAAGAERLPGLKDELGAARQAEAQAGARATWERARAALASAEAEAQKLIDDGPSHLDSVASLERRLAEARIEHDALYMEASKLEAPPASKLEALGSILDVLITSGVTTCPICGSEGVDLPRVRGLLDIKSKSAEAERAKSQSLSDRVSIAQSVVGNLKSELHTAKLSWTTRHRVTTERLESAARWVSEIGELVGSHIEHRPFASIEADIAALESSVAARKAWEDRVRSAKQLREDQSVVSALEKECRSTLQLMLRDIKSTAESEINRFSPFKVALEIGETSCSWSVMGADGRSHGLGAMSGAERAGLVFALAMAWAKNDGPRYVILDDVDLGLFAAGNLRAFLSLIQAHVLEGSITQAFVAWSRPSEIPDGWTVIVTDGLERG